MAAVPEETLSVTRTLFRVADLLGWARRKQLILRPTYQRGSVWNKKSKSYFIDTILRGFPIPIIFLQDRTDPKTYEPIRQVVDGQQRLRTVLGFIDPEAVDNYSDEDEFSISKIHNPSLAGKTFKDLTEDLKQRILSYEFSVHILPPSTPNRQVLEIFARMNATGTKANHQELRNAQYSGAFKQACYNLGLEWTDEWTGWRIFTKKNLARMDEIELTSELVLFILRGLTDKAQSRIDAAYKEFDDDFPHGPEVARRFGAAMSFLNGVYTPSITGIDTFRTRSWFYTLFTAAAAALFPMPVAVGKKPRPEKLDASKVRGRLDKLADRLNSDDLPEPIAKALRGASTDRQSRVYRANFVAPAFKP